MSAVFRKALAFFKTKQGKILSVLLVAAMVLCTALAVWQPWKDARADVGGSGGIGGNVGGVGGSGWEYRWWYQDNEARTANASNVALGWDQWHTRFNGSAPGTKPINYNRVDTACDKAKADAVAKHGGTVNDYRIIAVGMFIGNNQGGNRQGKVVYAGAPPANALLNSWNQNWAGGQPQKDLNAIPEGQTAPDGMTRQQYLDYINGLGQAVATASGAQTNAACVVLHVNFPGKPVPGEPDIPTPTPEPGSIHIKKVSAKPEYTDDNEAYDMEGIEYGVYSDKDCKTLVTKLVLDANGEATSDEVPAGTYYVKETKTKEGYVLNTTVYTVEVPEGGTGEVG